MKNKWKITAIILIIISVILLLSTLFYSWQEYERVKEFNYIIDVCEYQNGILNQYEKYLFDWTEISMPDLFGMTYEEMIEKYTNPS